MISALSVRLGVAALHWGGFWLRRRRRPGLWRGLGRLHQLRNGGPDGFVSPQRALGVEIELPFGPGQRADERAVARLPGAPRAPPPPQARASSIAACPPRPVDVESRPSDSGPARSPAFRRRPTPG